ncbi:hypothetical protein [Actinoplanes sp. NPDC020271]
MINIVDRYRIVSFLFFGHRPPREQLRTVAQCIRAHAVRVRSGA